MMFTEAETNEKSSAICTCRLSSYEQSLDGRPFLGSHKRLDGFGLDLLFFVFFNYYYYFLTKSLF